jgi:hypothetical protein
MKQLFGQLKQRLIKKLIVIFPILLILLLTQSNQSFSQANYTCEKSTDGIYKFTTDISQNSDRYRFVTPCPNSNLSCYKDDKLSQVLAFNEFCNGTFSFSNENNIIGPNRSLLSEAYDIKWDPNTNYFGDNMALTKLHGIYGKPPKPKPSSHANKNKQEDAQNDIRPTILEKVLSDATPVIKITPSIWSVVPGDMMTFVITYNIPQSDTTYNNYIIFYYNLLKRGKTTIAVPTFRVIDERNNTIGIDQLEGAISREVEIPAIRCYNGEIFELDENNITIIKFTRLKADAREHHIFISLSPNDNIYAADELLTNVSADIRYKPFNSDKKTDAHEVTLPIARSHDPNNILITPACLPSFNEAVKLGYTVNFRNTGRGNARDVRIVVNLGPNVDINTIRNISGFCGAGKDGKPKAFTEIIPTRGNHDPVIPSQIPYPRLIWHKIRSSNSICFSIPQANLKGVLLALNENDPVAMGQIKFSINTTPGNDTRGIISSVKIYFDEEKAVTDSESLGLCPPCNCICPSKPTKTRADLPKKKSNLR